MNIKQRIEYELSDLREVQFDVIGSELSSHSIIADTNIDSYEGLIRCLEEKVASNRFDQVKKTINKFKRISDDRFVMTTTYTEGCDAHGIKAIHDQVQSELIQALELILLDLQ